MIADRVNVLGTEYSILMLDYDQEEAFARRSIGGYCDCYEKKIVLCDMASFKGWEHEEKSTCEICNRQNLRHEIVHAFLSESGLMDNAFLSSGSWAMNEEMVDWMAIQGPKIHDAWKKAGALEC